jgi:hypothetical protein
MEPGRGAVNGTRPGAFILPEISEKDEKLEDQVGNSGGDDVI